MKCSNTFLWNCDFDSFSGVHFIKNHSTVFDRWMEQQETCNNNNTHTRTHKHTHNDSNDVDEKRLNQLKSFTTTPTAPAFGMLKYFFLFRFFFLSRLHT